MFCFVTFCRGDYLNYAIPQQWNNHTLFFTLFILWLYSSFRKVCFWRTVPVTHGFFFTQGMLDCSMCHQNKRFYFLFKRVGFVISVVLSVRTWCNWLMQLTWTFIFATLQLLMSAWESLVFYLGRPEGVIISPTLPCPLGKSNNGVQMHRGHFEMWTSSLKFPHWLYLPSEFIRILKKTFFYDCSSLSVLLVLSILARATKKIPQRTIRCPVALWTSPVLTWCSVGFSAAHSHRAFIISHHNPGKSNTFSLCGVVCW